MKNSLIALIALILFSCNNQLSLQKYFVENSEVSDFVFLDLGTSLINTEKVTLTASEKEALNSLKKLNVLIFKKDAKNESKFKTESNKVQTVLRNETYQELIKFNNSGKNITVYFIGEENNIDEFVVSASSNEKGFAVIRVLGNNMTPNNIFTLLEVIKKSKIDLDKIKPLQEMID